MKTTDTLVLFWRSGVVFSNWHPSAFTEHGIQLANTEQYMMWQKALLFGDTLVARQILGESDPRKLKDLGRKVAGYREQPWERARLDVMVRGCFLKFSQNPAMAEQLLATGDRQLVEASPYDTIWGIGLGEDDPRALDPAQWKGRNLLGVALMQVRQLLRDGKQPNNLNPALDVVERHLETADLPEGPAGDALSAALKSLLAGWGTGRAPLSQLVGDVDELVFGLSQVRLLLRNLEKESV